AAAYPEASKVSNEDIIRVALDFGIMTQFTSFVAVEKKVVNVGGKQRTVAVPVEMADGVSYEGLFGREVDRRVMAAPAAMAGGAGGFGGGGIAMKQSRAGFVTADSEKSPVVVRQDDSKMKPEERRKYRFESKVDKALRETTGKVE